MKIDNVSVARLMQPNVITLSLKNDSLESAEYLFKKNEIRHLPVVDTRNRIVGILSETDLLRVSFKDAVIATDQNVDTSVYKLFSISELMVKNVTTIKNTANIKEAAEILVSNEFHALPVTEKGKLIGIITSTDMIKYLLKFL